MDEFESSKNTAFWYQLFMDLTLNESSTHYTNEIDSDVTSLPGWSLIDEPLKERIIQLSKFYINNFNEDKDKWFGTNTFLDLQQRVINP